MVYYKFRGVHDRAPDDKHECGGEGCPEITVKFSGDLTGSGDCRQRLYGSDLTKLPVSENKAWMILSYLLHNVFILDF
jgi:hypothetical protein